MLRNRHAGARRAPTKLLDSGNALAIVSLSGMTMHFVLLPRNQAVGQFVLVIGLPGKMTREDFAATIDRFADSLACSIASQSLGDYFRDLLPCRGLNFGVDAAVGEHFHPMLEKRNDNQYSGMIPCVVKTVLRKRGKRQGVD